MQAANSRIYSIGAGRRASVIVQNVIPKNKKINALHVALCTVNKIDYLVSWNYRHLANVNREKKIISINIQHNYLHPLRICTPLELIDYGN
jgi:hypothetical protein